MAESCNFYAFCARILVLLNVSKHNEQTHSQCIFFSLYWRQWHKYFKESVKCDRRLDLLLDTELK